MSDVPRRVVCAAMRMKDGLIVIGVRHFSPDMRATLARLYPGKRYHLEVEEQGFINTHGEFLTREQAWVAAEANGQILRRCGGDGEILFSENLY